MLKTTALRGRAGCLSRRVPADVWLNFNSTSKICVEFRYVMDTLILLGTTSLSEKVLRSHGPSSWRMVGGTATPTA